MENELGVYVVKKFGQMDSARSTWKAHWEQVAEYVVPKKNDIYGTALVGEEKHNLLYDDTAVKANDKMAAMLHSHFTSSLSEWFELTTGDRELDKKDNIRQYLQKSANRMMDVLNQSNFQSQIHEVYVDLGSFGTACLRMEKDDKMVIRFTSKPIYEVVIKENYKGEIDTCYYEYEETLENIVEQFGEGVLNAELAEKYAENPMDKECIIHAIEPRKRTDMIKGKRGKGKPFASIHVLKRSKAVLKEEGFDAFPYAIPRWSKISGEMYGRSQAMKGLPTIRMMHQMSKATIEGAQLNIAPPVQLPDDSFLFDLDMNPLGANYYRAGTKDRIEPIITGSNAQIGVQLLEYYAKKIEDTFFINQAQLIDKDRMTAEETRTRRDENLRIFGPQAARLDPELIKPIIERTFALCEEAGELPPLPPELEGVKLEIKYKSLIAKAQRAIEAESFQRTLATVGPLAEAKPEMLDYLDGDEVIKHAADIFSLPHNLLKKDTDVAKIRKERVQMQQEMLRQQQEQHQAEVKSKTGEG